MNRHARPYDALRRGHALRDVFRGVVLLLLLTAGRAVPGYAESFSGRCVAVIDGDTVGIMRDGREVRVRLHGIDAPEKAQPYGAKAKAALSALVFGRDVLVDVRDRDRYGRTVAKLTVSGRSVDAELVRAGFAWWYQRYAPAARDLQAAEAAARRDRRGLWADPAPTPPWEWRRGPTSRAGANAQAGAGAVYVTRTGRSYHRAGCAYAARATGSVSRAEASSRGLAPCRVCKP